MSRHLSIPFPSTVVIGLFATVLFGALPASASASTSARGTLAANPVAFEELAQVEGTEAPELRPRYEPVPPKPQDAYNDEYIFGLTRSVAESTMHPAVRILLFPLTVPMDIVLLPFECIGGFF